MQTSFTHKKKVVFWWCNEHADALVQDCSNSSALAMELLQSCTKPSMWQSVAMQRTTLGIQCSAVIMRSIFLKNPHNRHSISSLLGQGAGSLLCEQTNLCNFWATAMLQGISCYFGPCYNSALLYLTLDSWQPDLQPTPKSHTYFPVIKHVHFYYFSIADVLSGGLWFKTHCGLVTPYGDRDLGQHWLR